MHSMSKETSNAAGALLRQLIAQQTVPFREVLPSLHFQAEIGEATRGAAEGEDPPSRATARHQG